MKNIFLNFLYIIISVAIISCSGQELLCNDIENRIESNNINIYIKDTNDEYSYTLLGHAIRCGNLDIVNKIINKNADINLAKSDGIYEYDALYVAIEEKKHSIVQYLLDKGINPNQIYNEDGLTPLTLSIINQDINITKLLIKYNANINGSGDMGGDRIIIPLKEAIDRNNKDVIKLLLEAGADISFLEKKDSIKFSDFNYSSKKQDNLLKLKGDYLLITKGEPIGNDEPSDIYYYFFFAKNKGILSIDSDNLNEIYCEGEYNITNQEKDVFQLIYIGEKVCSSDDGINTLIIKKTKEGYYIKGNRFLNKDWLKLKENN